MPLLWLSLFDTAGIVSWPGTCGEEHYTALVGRTAACIENSARRVAAWRANFPDEAATVFDQWSELLRSIGAPVIGCWTEEISAMTGNEDWRTELRSWMLILDELPTAAAAQSFLEPDTRSGRLRPTPGTSLTVALLGHPVQDTRAPAPKHLKQTGHRSLIQRAELKPQRRPRWRRRRPPTLVDLFNAPHLTPIDDLPPSVRLSERVHKFVVGVYAQSRPGNDGQTRLVSSIGWAGNDAWAKRVWFHSQDPPVEPDDSDRLPVPDLRPLGFPLALDFESARAFEDLRSFTTGPKAGVWITRLSEAWGGWRRTYFYEGSKPTADSPLVALEITPQVRKPA